MAKQPEFKLTTFQSFDEVVRNGFKMRASDKPIILDLPINWDMDPFQDRNWMFNFHSFRFIDSAIQSYVDKDDKIFLRFCVDFFIDWYDWHIARGERSRFAFFFWTSGA